jgi:hypothetical protein
LARIFWAAAGCNTPKNDRNLKACSGLNVMLRV